MCAHSIAFMYNQQAVYIEILKSQSDVSHVSIMFELYDLSESVVYWLYRYCYNCLYDCVTYRIRPICNWSANVKCNRDKTGLLYLENHLNNTIASEYNRFLNVLSETYYLHVHVCQNSINCIIFYVIQSFI